MLNINVSSHETSYCLFQGLSLGEMWQNGYLTIDELCSEFKTPSESLVTSYYTRGSSLYMVLYWYKGYTFINATISVNISKCPAVYLNICKYHKYCADETLANFNDYIYSTIHHTRLQFGNCGNYQNILHFRLPPQECVVFILFDKFDHFSKNK